MNESLLFERRRIILHKAHQRGKEQGLTTSVTPLQEKETTQVSVKVVGLQHSRHWIPYMYDTNTAMMS